MKNKILSFMFAICLIIPAMFLVSACDDSKNDFDQYITVAGIRTEYVVGEDLDLSNAILEYHTSKEDSSFVIVSEDMVAWQGTSVAGDFKLNVIYQGEKAIIDYVVYDADKMINTLIENLRSQDVVQRKGVLNNDFDLFYKQNALYEHIKTFMGDDGYYFDFILENEGIEEHYGYTVNSSGTIINPSKSIYDYNPDETAIGIELLMDSLFGIEPEVGITLINNLNGTYTLKYVSLYSSTEYKIKNKLIITESNYMGDELDSKIEYKYNEDAEFPELPDDIEWVVNDYRE